MSEAEKRSRFLQLDSAWRKMVEHGHAYATQKLKGHACAVLKRLMRSQVGWVIASLG